MVGISIGQPGFFDLSRQYESLDEKKDLLVTVAEVVPWELFRPKLRRLWRHSAFAPLRPRAGGWPAASLLILKALLVQALYNLSYEYAEY